MTMKLLTEIICELTNIKDTNTVTNKQVLAVSRWFEAPWSQTEVFREFKRNKVLWYYEIREGRAKI